MYQWEEDEEYYRKNKKEKERIKRIAWCLVQKQSNLMITGTISFVDNFFSKTIISVYQRPRA